MIVTHLPDGSSKAMAAQARRLAEEARATKEVFPISVLRLIAFCKVLGATSEADVRTMVGPSADTPLRTAEDFALGCEHLAAYIESTYPTGERV